MDTNAEADDKRPRTEDCVIDVKSVTTDWPTEEEFDDHTLTNVSFTVGPGQILAVVGQTGSGKVILIHSLPENMLLMLRIFIAELIIARDSGRAFSF